MYIDSYNCMRSSIHRNLHNEGIYKIHEINVYDIVTNISQCRELIEINTRIKISNKGDQIFLEHRKHPRKCSQLVFPCSKTRHRSF